MSFKALLVSALTLGSAQAIASPIAGTWQGPCETRGEKAVKFTYVISETNAEGVGEIAKTKHYFNDPACQDFSRTNKKSVLYTISDASAEGIYNLNIAHGAATLYDIVKVSDDGQTLAFGASFARSAEERPTTLSTDKRVFVRVAE